jgi:hypothetical protein
LVELVSKTFTGDETELDDLIDSMRANDGEVERKKLRGLPILHPCRDGVFGSGKRKT